MPVYGSEEPSGAWRSKRCQREGHSSAAGPGGRCVLGVWEVAGSASVWLQQKKQIERSAADSLCDADWPSPLQPANSPIRFCEYQVFGYRRLCKASAVLMERQSVR